MTMYAALIYSADVDWTAPEHAEEMGSTGSSVAERRR